MIESFKRPKFKKHSLKLIEKANEIIKQYQADEIQLTLRQLFYQFVAHVPDFENTEKSYKNLGWLISEARLCGLIDWSAIDDLGRIPSLPHFDHDLDTFLQQMREMASAYSLDRWDDQPYYVELHVEKQAAQSVLAPIADKWGIGFSMNKGYSSQTAFYDAGKRFIRAARAGKTCVCVYAGDHDPSGEDMVRDFIDRMRMFGAPVQMRKVAITMEQIKQFNCPPNPTKITDSRAAAYIEKFGHESWELDALEPKELRRIFEVEIRSLINKSTMEKVLAREKKERALIEKALSKVAA